VGNFLSLSVAQAQYSRWRGGNEDPILQSTTLTDPSNTKKRFKQLGLAAGSTAEVQIVIQSFTIRQFLPFIFDETDDVFTVDK